MEKVLCVNPFDGDDRAELNSLFEAGWATSMRLVREDEDGLLVYYHLERCGCHPPDEEEDYEFDEEEYEEEKRRRLKELDKLYPPPDDDNMPF